MITAILLDDEKKALSILKNKIEQYCPEVSLMAETMCPRQGIELILTLRPQLVFLDIAMPEMSGFDVLNKIGQPDFEVIFVTAFDQYAMDAIKHSALDYLLKPVVNSELIMAVGKAVHNIEQKSALKRNRVLIENLSNGDLYRKMTIPSRDGLEFVLIHDIIHLEGIDGYTKISLSNQSPILSSYSIGYFNELLANEKFYLVHKSHLINELYIKSYLNEGYILLSNNRKIPVARSRRNDFLSNFR